MSDNPYESPLSENPFEAPVAVSGVPRGNPLLPPAIILLVLSSLFGVYLLGSLSYQLYRVLPHVDTSPPERTRRVIGTAFAAVGWVSVNAAIIVGSIAMIRLKGYRSALAGAICATIPVCTPCFVLGIPFGIWAIALLGKQEIRECFRD